MTASCEGTIAMLAVGLLAYIKGGWSLLAIFLVLYVPVWVCGMWYERHP